MIYNAANRSHRSFRNTSYTSGPDPAGPAALTVVPGTATAALVVLIIYPFCRDGRSGSMVGAPMLSSLSGHL